MLELIEGNTTAVPSADCEHDDVSGVPGMAQSGALVVCSAQDGLDSLDSGEREVGTSSNDKNRLKISAENANSRVNDDKNDGSGNQGSSSSLHVSVAVDSISVSLIDREPAELLYFRMQVATDSPLTHD